MNGGWHHQLELRERTAELLEQIGAGDGEHAEAAAALLTDLRSVWVREKRWRNNGPPPVATVHVAGPVIDCREYRRSCPRYIVDRRQTCELCGAELLHGRWALFFEPGELVGVLGTITYGVDPTITWRHEQPCTVTGGEDRGQMQAHSPADLPR